MMTTTLESLPSREIDFHLNPQVLLLIAIQYSRMSNRAPQRHLGTSETISKIRTKEGVLWHVGNTKRVIGGVTEQFVALFREEHGIKETFLIRVKDLDEGLDVTLRAYEA